MTVTAIKAPPIRASFEKFGDRFIQIGYNPDAGMYLYKRELSTGPVYYEVFRRFYDNAQGCDVYPSTSSFGFGDALCIREHEYEKAVWYFNNGFDKGRYKDRAINADSSERVSDRATFTTTPVSTSTRKKKALKSDIMEKAPSLRRTAS